MSRTLLVLSLLVLVGLACWSPAWADGPPAMVTVFVGTYTRGSESKGIYQLQLDLRNGQLSEVAVTEGIQNPSFLALHPSQPYLYSVSEVSDADGNRSGAVQAFAIQGPDQPLKPLNRLASGGAGPCHLVVDPSGRNVLVANYGGGSVAAMSIGDNGQLQERTAFIQHKGSSVTPRQTAPHAHCIRSHAEGRFVLAADLGLDKVLIYRFDAGPGTLTANQPAAADLPPGSGPRHFRFHPSGRWVFVINELASTVSSFSFDENSGAMELLQTVSTLPENFEGNNSTAEVVISEDGRFLYGSNRGHDSIAAFEIDESTGRLSHLAHQSSGGKTPRNFAIEPTGRYLLAANQASDNIVVWAIQEDGRLRATGQEIRIPAPVCLVFQEP